MAGKRVLLAAEFSRGTATVSRLAPLGQALAERGHDVTFALPARVKDAVTGFPVVVSPEWDVPPPPGFVAVTYADLLLLGGYAAPGSLRRLLNFWKDALGQSEPDLLVADLAPTAMLTARIRGTRMAAIGDGYSLPPALRPMPVMRPWTDIDPGAAADIEGRVMAVIDACMTALRGPRLQALRDIFAGVPSFLCTFPEVDHYPGRLDGQWYGEIFEPATGPAPIWPDLTAERVYVELDQRHPALRPIASALQRLGLPSLTQGVTTTIGNRAASIASCDLVVCQGADVAVPALLAGKPLLMLPIFVEQMMTLHRVATQGLGHGLSPDADAEAIDAALRRLVDDRACRERAINFARTYDGYHPKIAIDAVADDIHDLLA